MRVTSSVYYDNLFSPNKNKLTNALYDVNKQISSGLKIEYAKDDVSIFSDTMRLDNEINTLEQASKSTNNALKMATQTDTTLNDFQTTLDRMKVLMTNAANGSNSDQSLDAIYNELDGLNEHLKNLANTSINGQFIFSGSALDTKPIDDFGNYHGNDKELKAFGGSDIQIQYNITGSELFLGEESQTHRKITTNLKNLNQTALYPDVMEDSSIPRDLGKEVYITESDTIRDLMGDNDTDPTNNNPYYFYVTGTDHNGENFNTRLKLDADQTVSELMDSIQELYGHDSVNVTLNEHGQIEIEDKVQGSSKLDFHMVGATDFKGADDLETAGNDLESLENIDGVYLKGFTKSEFAGNTPNVRSIQNHIDPNNFSINGEFIEKPSLEKATSGTLLTDVFDSDVSKIHLGGVDVNGNAVDSDFDISGKTLGDLVNELNDIYDDEANGNDYLSFYIEDGKIKFDSNDETASDNISIELEARNDNDNNNVKGFDTDSFLSYDKIDFKKSNDEIYSNVSQIVRSDNSYAIDSTKLSEVADLSKGTAGTLDGTNYVLEGYDINGVKFSTTIKLDNNGSTFDIVQDTDGDGDLSDETAQTYDIYNVDGSKTKADEMTYRQFMDVINMSMTDQLPTDDDGDGTISSDEYFKAISDSDIYAQTSLNDKGQVTFKELNATSTQAQMMLYDANSPESTLTFQANNALEISDPKTDFFAQIDEAIESVKLGRYRADGDDANNPRNVGIQNGIQIIDDLSAHVTKSHAKIGALSNSLQNANQRSELLSVSTQTLRSSVIDTDIAEASLRLNQLTLNYQAMLSTVGKVSKLSLVNYL